MTRPRAFLARQRRFWDGFVAFLAEQLLIFGERLAAGLGAEPYDGRHRADGQSTSERNVAEAERQALVAVLREPTQDMPVPDFHSDLTHYELSGGNSHYLRLKQSVLDAGVEAVLTRTEIEPRRLPLRGAAPRTEDIDDEAWAAAREAVGV